MGKSHIIKYYETLNELYEEFHQLRYDDEDFKHQWGKNDIKEWLIIIDKSQKKI